MVKFSKSDASLPKVRNIVEAGRELFWKFGIRRVSVEEICRKAKVSKVTFYKYFENKTDLAIHLLENSFEESIGVYRELMSRDIPFKEKVRESIRLKFEGTRDVSDELIHDIMGHPDNELKEYYAGLSARAMGDVVKGYADAQKKGEIRQDIKLEFILYFMGQMMRMAEDENLISIYGSSREVIMELLNFFFYGILPREND